MTDTNAGTARFHLAAATEAAEATTHCAERAGHNRRMAADSTDPDAYATAAEFNANNAAYWATQAACHANDAIRALADIVAESTKSAVTWGGVHSYLVANQTEAAISAQRQRAFAAQRSAEASRLATEARQEANAR